MAGLQRVCGGLGATLALVCAYLYGNPRPLRRNAAAIFDWFHLAGLYSVALLDGSRLSQGRGLDIPHSLEGQVALITGGTKGIGYHAAIRLHSLGADVVVTGRKVSDAEQAAAWIRAEALGVGASVGMGVDTSDFDSVRSFAVDLVAMFPELHLLVLNAGTSNKHNATKADTKEYIAKSGHGRVLAANHLGHFLLGLLLAPHLAVGARVVVVSSIMAWWANPAYAMIFFGSPPPEYSAVPKELRPHYQCNLCYEASKFANMCFAHALRPKMARRNITVVVMTPGQVDTAINNNNMEYERDRAATPAEGGRVLFESIFVSRTPMPEFVYPYWFPEPVFRSSAPESTAATGRSLRHPKAKGYRYEGPRGWIYRPEKFQLYRFELHGSLGPECTRKTSDKIWKWSRKAVGLPERLDNGDIFKPILLQSQLAGARKRLRRFELEDQDARLVTLQSFPGTRLLLYWYPHAEIADCPTEVVKLRGLHPQFLRWNVQVLGASAEPAFQNRAFSTKCGVPFPLLSDVSGSLPRMVAAEGRWAALLDEGRAVVKLWRDADPRSFPEESLRWVKASLPGAAPA